MDKFCLDFVKKITKKLRTHLRSLFSSNETELMPPTGRVPYFDKNNYRTKYPNFKKRHQRHEQNK